MLFPIILFSPLNQHFSSNIMSDNESTLPPQPKKNKKFLKILLGLLILTVSAMAVWYFLFPVQERDIFHFVPEDAIYIIESQTPIDDWKELAGSAIWQYMKTHEYFEEINESADYLDSLVQNNKALCA